DRAVDDDAWIADFLAASAVGTLATVSEGQPFLNTNIYAYDPESHAIYFHTAGTGRTRSNVEAHEKVCFTVSEMGRLLPAERALNFSVEYSGVVAFGRGRVLDDDAEKEAGLVLLMAKYAPHLESGVDYAPPSPEELARTSVYRIDVDAWSGKKKKVDDDFPGAYHWRDVAEPGA
ncbi:MAG: pyridoxamine 5'-phosphate oxidase family protein, partial [Thermoanaerobaculia bacterium]|nr:pyridoxamine 5'-phosphate oxidase family protein [Thermoanaerobaculia bacterium]